MTVPGADLPWDFPRIAGWHRKQFSASSVPGKSSGVSLTAACTLWHVKQTISPDDPTTKPFSRIVSVSRPFVTFSKTGCASAIPPSSRIVFWASWHSRQEYGLGDRRRNVPAEAPCMRWQRLQISLPPAEASVTCVPPARPALRSAAQRDAWHLRHSPSGETSFPRKARPPFPVFE